MALELWDTEHRNIIGAYESESEALRVVREAVERHGATYAATMALVSERDDGDIETLAIGETRVKRAGIRAAWPADRQ